MATSIIEDQGEIPERLKVLIAGIAGYRVTSAWCSTAE
jgi:hypothetical protein